MRTGCRGIRDVDWAAVVRTAAVHRTHFDARAAMQARDAGRRGSAASAGEGRAHAAVSVGARLLGGVVFRVPGAGQPVAGMGRALLAAWRCFREAFAACVRRLRRACWLRCAPCWAERRRGGRRSIGSDVVQPVLFAMGVGLAAVWRSLGVRRRRGVGAQPRRDRGGGGGGGAVAGRGVPPGSAARQADAGVAEGGAMMALEAREAEVQPRLERSRGGRLRGRERAAFDGGVGR